MIHDALTSVALGTHATLLVGVLAAYYKYGDRTEITARGLQGTDATLREIRRKIAASLADAVREQLAAPTLILEASTESYVERPSNPLESERYREAVRDFVEGNSSFLIDCRNLTLYRNAWLRAARRLSWILLAFGAYEGAVAGALALVDKTGVFSIPDVAVLLAAIPTALFFLAGLLCLGSMQVDHDRIMSIRNRYGETPV